MLRSGFPLVWRGDPIPNERVSQTAYETLKSDDFEVLKKMSTERLVIYEVRSLPAPTLRMKLQLTWSGSPDTGSGQTGHC